MNASLARSLNSSAFETLDFSVSILVKTSVVDGEKIQRITVSVFSVLFFTTIDLLQSNRKKKKKILAI